MEVRGIALRVFLALALLTWAGTAGATTLIRASVDELVRSNDTIVVGEVLDAESYWNSDGSFILTDVVVKTHELVKGDLSKGGEEIVVTLMGGTVGETTTLIVAGATLVPGRSYVLFLNPEDLPGAEQALTVRDHCQGAFDLLAGKGGELRAVSQALGHPLLADGQGLTDAAGGADGFPLDALVENVRQIAAQQQQEVK
jgi:hypothetical protein